MSRFPISPPAFVEPVGSVGLGRLGPALERLAAMQGTWPPVVPRAMQSIVVRAGAQGTAGDEDTLDGSTALDGGTAEADRSADAGVDLIVLGSSGCQVPGLVAAAVLLGLEPVEAVGTRPGPDWSARTIGVRDGVVACRSYRGNAEALVQALGDVGLARLTGLLAQSAVRRTPVLLDGSPLVLGAALLASRLAPGAEAWWLPGQSPPAPGAARALLSMGLEPLLDLGIERAEGAALACGVLVQAVELVRGGQE